jgi:hypothetical protein
VARPRPPKRVDYRNGFYKRDDYLTLGTIQLRTLQATAVVSATLDRRLQRRAPEVGELILFAGDFDAGCGGRASRRRSLRVATDAVLDMVRSRLERAAEADAFTCFKHQFLHCSVGVVKWQFQGKARQKR